MTHDPFAHVEPASLDMEKRLAAEGAATTRGHHKRQAHGPGGSLRKWIHVEPYWRGPDDAPIAVRSHQLPDRGNP